jgi:hypothetical protein
MRNKPFFHAAFAIAICLFIVVSGKTALADSNIPPTILSSSQIENAGTSQILVNGLVPTNCDALIYINGKYDGIANISQINDDVAKFSYLSSLFSSNQKFEVMVVSKNRISLEYSAPAISIVNSVIEKTSFRPAKENSAAKTSSAVTITPPTIITPATTSCISTLYVSGATINHTSVYIYIDGKVPVIIPASTGSSVYSLFSYTPTTTLDRGDHYLYAVAQDNAGNKSSKSATINFCISAPQILTATSTAEMETTNIDYGATKTPNQTSSVVFQKTTKSSMSAKDKSIINIIIFLLFIIGLLVWMIFVNRELAQDKPKNDEITKQ